MSGPAYMKKFISTHSTSCADLKDIPIPDIPKLMDSLPDGVSLDILDNPQHARAARDHSLLMWLSDYWEMYLQELLQLEGRGDLINVCAECNINSPFYHCRDCFGGQILCQECTVQGHTLSPLHHLEYWNGAFFQKTSLKSLGLHIQLGHIPGEICGNPKHTFNDDFTVIDSHGIHAVAMDYSTATNPCSATTFHLLQEFQLLSFESKVLAYKFYQSLACNSDDNGISDIKDCYESFICSICEWCHLRMLKQSGRGHDHDPAGIMKTASGECAVLCPACPHPGINLPDGWENAPPDKQWLYADFVTIDANFHLNLSHGWVYFVEDNEYRTFLSEHQLNVQEKNTCSSHITMNMADSKSNQGLATTGVGSIVCARHNFKCPNGIVDLEKGERYANMDYAFFSAMQHSSCKVLNVSYDIACQWHKNLWTQMSALPPSMHLEHTAMYIRFFVPKFHLPAHISKCHMLYSFNFLPGIGCTDGEAPERGWSSINPAASSTKEMGPGSRCDTLDDYFGDWNWKKLTSLGTTLLHKLKDAICESAEHWGALQELENALMHDEPQAFTEWKEEMYAWEADPSKMNPFDPRVETLMQATICLQLVRDDTQALRDSSRVILHNDVSPSILIRSGLDLEEQQCHLHLDKASLGLHASDRQEGSVLNKLTSLQHHIDSWTGIQQLYMPVVSLICQHLSTNLGMDQPEDYPLCLPSAIVATSSTCDKILMEHEWKLCQGANTHAHGTLKRVEAKITILLNNTGWQTSLCTLKPDDIHSKTDMLDMETEGTWMFSWIWKVHGASQDEGDPDGSLDAMHIEWCKARAHTN
ncbi:hypothetical protein EDC04DRAFT_2870152 [Pisolithus marmoratus]|nr:hypothetical protein EDC04DRAFT_2870152 [Pisolithus marmoratus]